MANATCQFTQGGSVGGNGQSVVGFVPSTVVTMTDAGGSAALTTWLWEILSWPAPLMAPPTITNATSQVATVTPPLDGVFIVRLTRVENSVTTIDVKFFGVVDGDGLCLPSAGQTGAMTNVGTSPTLSENAGWMGRADAGTNIFTDAYFRFLKASIFTTGGDVTGTSGAQTVVAIQGNPVENGSPTDGQVLTWVGVDSQWEPVFPASGFTAGGDLTGSSSNQTVSFLRGLPVPLGSTAALGNVMSVVYAPPWAQPTDIAYDGASLWVADAGLISGVNHVVKVDPTFLTTTQYALPSGTTSSSRIISDGTNIYMAVAASSDRLLVLSKTTGAVIGLGQFSSPGTPVGLALDGAGNVWTVDPTSGLQKFSISAMIAAYPSGVPAAASLAGSYIDVTSDGSSLYASDGSGHHIFQINPATPAIVATYTDGSSRSMQRLFWNSGVAGVSSIWATTNSTTVVRVGTGLMTLVAAITVTGAHAASLDGLGTDGTHIFASNSNSGWIEVINPSTNVWLSEFDSVITTATAMGRMIGVSGGVWVTLPSTNPTGFQGIQLFFSVGAGSYKIGPLGLAYAAPALPQFTLFPNVATPSAPSTGWVTWSSLTGELGFRNQNGLTYLGVGPGYIDLPTSIIEPAAPGTGQRIYVDSADGILKMKNSSALVQPLGFTASGDLSGSNTSQTVVAFQGKAVSSNTPNDQDVLTWVAANNDWEPQAQSSGAPSPAGPFNYAEAWVAYKAQGIAQGLATSVANLCVGPTFFVASPSGISCSGADFGWSNGGSVSHLLKATLWDMTTTTAVASGTLTVTADGRYQITWSPVTLVGGRYYWLTVGPNDGSSVFGWLVSPAGATYPNWFGQMFIYPVNSNYTTTNTATVASNYSQVAPVWPILTGS